MLSKSSLALLFLALVAPAAPASWAEGEDVDLGDLGAELARKLPAAFNPVPPAPPSPLAERKGEAWAFNFENDLWAFRSLVADGWAVTHLSADVDEYSENNLFRRLRDTLDDLAWVGDGGRFHDRISFTLGQELHTPPDITRDPPKADHEPYSGLLYLDTMVHSRSQREQMLWGLRLGVVGEVSLGEPVQKGIQSATGGDTPEGWDYQLLDEFVFTMMGEYRYRWLRGEFWGSDWDLEPIFGGQLGTWSIYVNTGLRLRYGTRLPDEFGVTNFRLGTRGNPVYVTPKDKGWTRYLFTELQGFYVFRYLPIDGNTFRNSPSAERIPYVGQISSGLAFGKGDFLFAYAFSMFNDKYTAQPAGDVRYGTLTLSWSR
jgi:hypothetical protein